MFPGERGFVAEFTYIFTDTDSVGDEKCNLETAFAQAVASAISAFGTRDPIPRDVAFLPERVFGVGDDDDEVDPNHRHGLKCSYDAAQPFRQAGFGINIRYAEHLIEKGLEDGINPNCSTFQDWVNATSISHIGFGAHVTTKAMCPVQFRLVFRLYHWPTPWSYAWNSIGSTQDDTGLDKHCLQPPVMQSFLDMLHRKEATKLAAFARHGALRLFWSLVRRDEVAVAQALERLRKSPDVAQFHRVVANFTKIQSVVRTRSRQRRQILASKKAKHAAAFSERPAKIRLKHDRQNQKLRANQRTESEAAGRIRLPDKQAWCGSYLISLTGSIFIVPGWKRIPTRWPAMSLVKKGNYYKRPKNCLRLLRRSSLTGT